MGQRTLAVDARVRPEVDEDHLAPQLAQAQRLVTGRVEPCRDAREIGRTPEVRKVRLAGHEHRGLLVGRAFRGRGGRRGGGPGREVTALRITRVGRGTRRLLPLELRVGRRELVLMFAAQLAQLRAGGADRLDVVLERRGVAGHIALEGPEPVEGDGERRDGEHDAGHPAHRGQVRAQSFPVLGGPFGEHGEHEQRHGDPGGVDERHEDGREPDMVAGGRHRDRGQDRPGAGHEDEAQAQPEDEASPLVGVARGAQPGERPLNDVPDGGDHEADGKNSEHGDPQPEQEVLREVQEAEHRAGEEDGQAEAGDQPGDDQVRPGAAGRGRASGHDHRDDRHDARGEAGDEATEERDDEQLTHGRRSSARNRSLALLDSACPRRS